MGHDFGGACISYAMEAFASKVAKAVFVSAAMLTNGQNAAGVFSQKVGICRFLFPSSFPIWKGRHFINANTASW